MIVKKLGALGAVSLILASTAAVAAPAPIRASDSASIKTSFAGKSLSGRRAGAKAEEGSKAAGGLGVVLLVAVAAGAAYGAYELIDGDNNDAPASN